MVVTYTFLFFLQIQLVWPGPLTVAKLLYYCNCYVSIAGIIRVNYSIDMHKFIIRL